MTYTIAQRDALKQAIASGVLRLSYDGKTVEYRSVEELRVAMRDVRRGLSEQATATGLWPGAPRQIRINTSKGT